MADLLFYIRKKMSLTKAANAKKIYTTVLVTKGRVMKMYRTVEEPHHVFLPSPPHGGA
jgi:hypothetical protein